MSSTRRIKAVTTDGIGAMVGGGGPLTITGLRAAAGSPKSAEGRMVDLVFLDYADARDFAQSILRIVGGPA
jgi:hypothetical protein